MAGTAGTAGIASIMLVASIFAALCEAYHACLLGASPEVPRGTPSFRKRPNSASTPADTKMYIISRIDVTFTALRQRSKTVGKRAVLMNAKGIATVASIKCQRDHPQESHRRTNGIHAGAVKEGSRRCLTLPAKAQKLSERPTCISTIAAVGAQTGWLAKLLSFGVRSIRIAGASNHRGLARLASSLGRLKHGFES